MIDRHWMHLRLSDGTQLAAEGTYTLDKAWTPYVQASATVTTPASLTALDPRTPSAVSVTVSATFGGISITADLSYLFGGRTTAAISTAWGSQLTSWVTALPERKWNTGSFLPAVQRTASLWVRSIRSTEDGTTVISLAGIEIIVQEQLLLTFDAQDHDLSTARELVNYIMQFDRSGLAITLQAGATDASLPIGTNPDSPTSGNIVTSVGQSLWDAMEPPLSNLSLRLYGDEDGLLYLGTRVVTPPGSVTLTGTIVESSDTIDLQSDEWTAGILLVYLRGGVETGYETTYYPTTAIKRQIIEIDATAQLNHFMSDTDFKAPAKAIYDRLVGRGHIFSIRATSDYSIAPFWRAYITLPTAVPQKGIIQAITWQIPEGEMTVTTQELENA